MSPKNKRKPSPKELLEEVRTFKPARTYEFDEYLDVVHELKNKDHSYADIAAFLTEKLGIAITRGQVYRAHMLWLELQEEIKRRDDEERRQSEEEARDEVQASREDDDRFGEPEDELADEPEPPQELDEDERVRREIADDVLKYLMGKYPHSAFTGEYSDILKFALAKMDSETRDELVAKAEDQRLESRKDNSHDRTTGSKSS